MRILLVEDEPNIARPVVRALLAQGHQVRHAPDLTNARLLLAEAEPDLLILDVRLPESEDGGFILAQEVREAGYKGPILFMTARDALADRVRGLDGGGDDYVVKPFELPELLARVRALLRRVSEVRQSRVQYGPLELDLTNRSVRWKGRPVDLSGREYALLERLVMHPDRVYSPEELLDLIWGEEASDTGVVKVCVHHLRSKLNAGVVRTVPGGYKLGVEP
ncbi:MAG: response regulator transcription factor [Meiothermus sp.]|uniref:response regulator transcription factor n=1 Tax=Meiothermus sp. TaxID=1955249 RepID=UPI0025FD3DDF|nr:response regulator transcription factor [Meiothermus sp.]MCS7057360.1 response regulator transcription factor [Meiothermus sp.]MCS7193354.1 response regulator transcription factor [Meiothermus sp.]MCX7741328.1 response regulator transcription factor [Meiothermus sp.]MDW8091761.1 response regulator transcription factor [Meiothermus sp.]MDW8480565.1 response regulator transcription factor [Meiothermus sp.]